MRNRMTGTKCALSQTMGKPTAFPHDVEEQLADGLKTISKGGWRLSRLDVLEVVGKFVTDKNKTSI